jgi:hypothetical protein
MDPNENLKRQRELAAEIADIWNRCDDTGDLSQEDAYQAAETALELSELVIALDEWRGKGGYDPYAPNERWADNAIQFPRLLAEIVATQQLDMHLLCESMDLDMDDLNELLDRADDAWERAKGNRP